MTLDLKLAVAYDDFELRVDQNIPTQGITAVFGPSGSGKTSLLRAIAGLSKSTNSRIRFGQQVWQDGSTCLATHARRLAYVFQEPSLFAHLSVRDNIEYGFKRVAEDQRAISPKNVIEPLGLATLLNRFPATLSGGEKQRVAIARALCSNPKLLLMDEPLAALDRDSKREILPLIAALKQNFAIPILYVSHALDEVARLADHLILLERGRVRASGNIQSMLTKLDLSLAQDVDAESLIEAVVAEHDDEYELTYLDSKIGRISIPKRAAQVGENLRVVMAARDVSITLEQQCNTSILNIFSAKIEQLEPAGESQLTIQLSSNGVPVLARITKKSAALMQLKSDDMVYIQVKSVAIL